MPLLKAKLAYTHLEIDQGFELLADDPAAGPDIQKWAERVSADIHVTGSDPVRIKVIKRSV